MTENYPLRPTSTSPDGITLRGWAWIVEILYLATYVTGITCIVGVVIAYVKRGEAAGTIYESHMTYAIRSFWIGTALVVVGAMLSIVGVGFILLILAGFWWLARLIRPLICLLDGRAINNPTGFF